MEVNCSVLGFDSEVRRPPSPKCPPRSERRRLLDFADKYLTSGGQRRAWPSLKRIMPAPVGRRDDSTAHRIAFRAQIFRALDCKGVVRIDYMLDQATTRSTSPRSTPFPARMAFYLWQESGVSYPQLIDKLVEYAEKAFAEKNENNYAYTSDILNGVVLGGKKGGKL